MGLKPTRDWVAIIVAVGLATALNMFTFAVLYDALFGNDPGLSENGTQVLTGWGGGMIGLLGAYIGAQAMKTRGPAPSVDGGSGARGGAED